MVPDARFELACQNLALDFKSEVSADSTNRAFKLVPNLRFELRCREALASKTSVSADSTNWANSLMLK